MNGSMQWGFAFSHLQLKWQREMAAALSFAVFKNDVVKFWKERVWRLDTRACFYIRWCNRLWNIDIHIENQNLWRSPAEFSWTILSCTVEQIFELPFGHSDTRRSTNLWTCLWQKISRSAIKIAYGVPENNFCLFYRGWTVFNVSYTSFFILIMLFQSFCLQLAAVTSLLGTAVAI